MLENTSEAMLRVESEASAREAILQQIDDYLKAHSVTIDDLPVGSSVIDTFVALLPFEAPVQSEQVDSNNIGAETSKYLVDHHGFPPAKINQLHQGTIMMIFRDVITGSAASDPPRPSQLVAQ